MRQPEVASGTPVTSTSDLPSIQLAWHRVTSRPQRNGPDDDPVMVLGPHLFEHRFEPDRWRLELVELQALTQVAQWCTTPLLHGRLRDQSIHDS